MSQAQPNRPQQSDQEPVTYGDVFNVSGELASKPVAPRDAAAAQAVEGFVVGHTLKGGPAAVMQSAADVNVSRGVLSREDVTGGAVDHGVTITLDDDGNQTIASEAVAGKVVGKFILTEEDEKTKPDNAALSSINPVTTTIGQALESVVKSAGDKPVDEADAAAIQVAELRATGKDKVEPGSITAAADSAAKKNAGNVPRDKKIKLRDILDGAAKKLTCDKMVTKEDADAIMGAELRNRANMVPHPGGVAASVAASLRLNQQKN